MSTIESSDRPRPPSPLPRVHILFCVMAPCGLCKSDWTNFPFKTLSSCNICSDFSRRKSQLQVERGGGVMRHHRQKVFIFGHWTIGNLILLWGFSTLRCENRCSATTTTPGDRLYRREIFLLRCDRLVFFFISFSWEATRHLCQT